MIKNLATISLFIFWTIVTTILTAGLVFYNKNNNSTVTTQTAATKLSPGQTLTLSLTEIAKHNSSSDCWIIISNDVYDVSSDIPVHPGGASTIMPYCGKDASSAFQTKDIGRNHSSSAYTWLAQLKLGTVGQTINGSTVNQVKSTTPALTNSGEND